MKVGFTHESHRAESVSWYTPPSIFEMLGTDFDLDVCAPQGGVPWIPAKEYIALPQDGLAEHWKGRVWCNPPYGKETPNWLKKMCDHGNGIALVFARTDTKWFHEYATKANALLFMKGRVQFVDGLNKTNSSGSTNGSVLLAYGTQCSEVLSKCKDSGFLVVNKE